jgi:hypothetical protein
MTTSCRQIPDVPCLAARVLAGTTAHAGEAVLEDAAGEILLDHLGDDRPPVSVTVGEPLVAALANSLGSPSHRRYGDIL